MEGFICIEWAPFALRAGVSETHLLDASEILQREFLDRQPGFVRRELLKADSGQWVDLVVWTSQAAAESAEANAARSHACHGYLGLMAGANSCNPGAGVSHFAQIREYGPAGC